MNESSGIVQRWYTCADTKWIVWNRHCRSKPNLLAIGSQRENMSVSILLGSKRQCTRKSDLVAKDLIQQRTEKKYLFLKREQKNQKTHFFLRLDGPFPLFAET